VVAGLTVGAEIWPRFVSQEMIHGILHTTEFVGNTLVFVLAGMLFGEHCMQHYDIIFLADFQYLAVLYLSSIAIRGVMVCALWPVLTRVGPAITPSDGVILVWSGLRGAVGLALAIVVDLSEDFEKEFDRQGYEFLSTKLSFHVGGMAAITLLINGSLAPLVLRTMGYMRKPSEQIKLFKMVEKDFHERTNAHMHEEMDDKDLVELFGGVDADEVARLVPGVAPINFTTHVLLPSMAEESLQNRLKLLRRVVLRTVKSIYLDMADKGRLPRTSYATRMLLECADRAMLTTGSGLVDYELVSEKMAIGKYLTPEDYYRGLGYWRLYYRLMNSSRVHFPGYIARVIAALIAFVYAHERAMKEIAGYFDVPDLVIEESEQQVAQARAALDLMPSGLVRDVRTKMLAGSLLKYQKQHLRLLTEKGILTQTDMEVLEHEVSHAIREMKHREVYREVTAGELELARIGSADVLI